MGVATDHLGRDVIENPTDSKEVFLFGDPGKKQDHEKKIAQFFPERRR